MKDRLLSRVLNSLSSLEEASKESANAICSVSSTSFQNFKHKFTDVKDSLERLDRRNNTPSENLMEVNSQLEQVRQKLEEAADLYKSFGIHLEADEAQKIELEINDSQLLEAVHIKAASANPLKCDCRLRTEESQLLLETREFNCVALDVSRSGHQTIKSPRNPPSIFQNAQPSKIFGNPRKFQISVSHVDEDVSHRRTSSFHVQESRFEDLPALRQAFLQNCSSKVIEEKKIMRKSFNQPSTLGLTSNELSMRQFSALNNSFAAHEQEPEQALSSARLSHRVSIRNTPNSLKAEPSKSARRISVNGGAHCATGLTFSSDGLKKWLAKAKASKRLEAIALHKSVFDCDPLGIIASVFSRALSQPLTIDLRESQYLFGYNKTLLSKLQLRNIKIIF